MSYGFVVKALDVVPIEFSEQFDIPRAPVIYRMCETEEKVAKYFIETKVNISKKN